MQKKQLLKYATDKVKELLKSKAQENSRDSEKDIPSGFKETLLHSMGTVVGPLLVSIIVVIVVVLICIIAVVSVIIGVVTFITETIIMSGMDGLTGGSTTQLAGAQYVWNETDLQKMPDEWSKNLYRLGWIITENKELQFSDMSIELLMGLPVSETSSMFYPTGDDHYVPPNITGQGQNWNTLSISEYATVGGAFPYNKTYDYITGLYATDASYAAERDITYAWGCPAAETLKTDTLGPIHKQHINTYADGDVNKSVYSVAYSVANTIYAYEMYRNTSLYKDADYGYAHQYKKYWECAAQKYNISVDDVQAQKDIYNLLYYWIHGGGVWTHTDVADDFAYMAFDYATYIYTQLLGKSLGNIRLSETYADVSALKGIGTFVTRGSVRGINNIDHDSASEWYIPTYMTEKGVKYEFLEIYIDGDWVVLSEPVVKLWMNYNQDIGTKEALKLIETYEQSYLHTNKILVRQANYTVSTGVSTVAVGASRLQYIFDILGIAVTTNERGFICYVGQSGLNLTTVPSGYYKGDFEGTLVDGMSNYRDSSWFVQLNNSEWSNPLNPEMNGGLEVTSRYGIRHYDGITDWHSGFDMVYTNRCNNLEILKRQYPIYAMHTGIVVAVNRDVSSSAGRYIHYKVKYWRNNEVVERYITYMHMSEIPTEITVGSELAKGQLVGYMGGSGKGSEFGYDVHLHMSLSTNAVVAGNAGRLDVETELPFVTMYPKYDKWFPNGNSGKLKQQPAYPLDATESDPQSVL